VGPELQGSGTCSAALGVATASAAASGASSRIIPVSARFGPNSTKVSQPSSRSRATQAAQRTGELSWRYRTTGMVEASP
jgi:hypothetical protein